jgi:hypothetical protein
MSKTGSLWREIGNGYSSRIAQADNGTWGVWVKGNGRDPFCSAWGLSRNEAEDNLTGVVTDTYGDGRTAPPTAGDGKGGEA